MFIRIIGVETGWIEENRAISIGPFSGPIKMHIPVFQGPNRPAFP
jgi:hypothetical protein